MKDFLEEIEERIIVIMTNIEGDNNREWEYTDQEILDDLEDLLEKIRRQIG